MQFCPKEAVVKETRLPRAFIDEDGDLVIFDSDASSNRHVCLTSEGLVVYYDTYEATVELKSAQRILYEGDALTVTF